MEKAIAYTTFTNTSGLEIISVSDEEVKVVPVACEWRGEVETCPVSEDGDGFMFGEMLVRFDECMRI